MKIDHQQKKISLVTIAIVAVVIVAGISQIWFSKNGKSILEDYAKRDDVESVNDLVYIGENKTALADMPTGNSETIQIAKKAFAMVNDKRVAEGLEPLQWSDALEQAAAIRAKDVTREWSHKRPDGSIYWSVNPEIMCGENISKGYRTAEAAVAAWMESEVHRLNLMDNSFGSMAIFIYEGDNSNWYWAIEFGK